MTLAQKMKEIMAKANEKAKTGDISPDEKERMEEHENKVKIKVQATN